MILDKVEIINLDGIPMLQCRHAQVAEDGTKYGYHRHVINALDDVSGEPAAVQALAASIFTDEIKATEQARVDAEAAKAEAERLEAERIAAEAEAAKLAEQEAARLAEEAAEAQRVADEQARIDAAVAAALEAQSS